MKITWLNKFIKKSREIKLSPLEKRAMLSHVIGRKKIPSPYYYLLTAKHYQKSIALSLAVLVIVFTSGGTSFAAESSLPGDALYSIKVNVNEEIQNFVAITPDAKAKVAVSRTSRRLQEAEELSKQGKLTSETQAIIQTNIQKHADDIKTNLATLASENATATVKEVVSDLKISLATHDATSSDVHLDSILNTVNEVKDQIDILSGTGTSSATSTHPVLPANPPVVPVHAEATTTASTTPPVTDDEPASAPSFSTTTTVTEINITPFLRKNN